MPIQSLWVHGNALKSETEKAIEQLGYYGWGTDIHLIPGTGGWFHIPLAAIGGNNDYKAFLQKVHLLFYSCNCEIREVHIYDGSIKIQSFEELHLSGEHRYLMNANNSFLLKEPHPVFCGIGLSFYCVANITSTEEEAARLIIASAGADYRIEIIEREAEDTDNTEKTEEERPPIGKSEQQLIPPGITQKP